MTTVFETLEQLEGATGTGSKEDKLDLLGAHRRNQLLQDTLTMVFDPFIVFNVKKTKKIKPLEESVSDDDDILNEWLSTLRECSARTIVGNAAKDKLEATLKECTAMQQKWCIRILSRNLRIGASESTINKIWPGLIKEFTVMLAETLKTTFVEGFGLRITQKVVYPIWGEPKLDGFRCVAMKRDGVTTLYSRSGEIKDSTPRINAAFDKYAPDNTVFDGETFGTTWNDTAEVVGSKKTLKDDSNISFHTWDSMSIEEWDAKKQDRFHFERRGYLANTIFPQHFDGKTDAIKLVPGKLLHNDAEVLAYYAECMDAGFEGIMLKDPQAPYVWDRSDSIYKMKAFVTYEGVIVGWYHGRKGSQFEHVLGGWEVLLPNGITTHCGGGLKKDFRLAVMLEGPESYFGRILEVQAQAEPNTPDGLTPKGKLRFPVIKRFREPGDVDHKVLAAYNRYLEVRT